MMIRQVFCCMRTSHSQRGVNLIELMVAMAIGLFLVLGATTLYVNTKKTSDVDDSIARLQETARYALSIIETDVRMSNNWGISKDGAAIQNVPKNNIPPAQVSTALGASTASNYCGAVFAGNANVYLEGNNNGYPPINANFLCTANSTASSSADTLTTRHAVTTASPATNTRLQVCANRTETWVTRGADPVHCTNGFQYFNMITNLYYIDRASDQGNTIPSLRRKTLGTDGAQPATPDVEVIPGVEDMQVEYGWDDSNDPGNAAGAVRYLQPQDPLLSPVGKPAGTGGRIVAVRVWLLIRAETPDSAFTDTRTYSYADRTGAAVSNLNVSATGADGAQYTPNDNFRRLLVSRTFFIRNVTGT